MEAIDGFSDLEIQRISRCVHDPRKLAELLGLSQSRLAPLKPSFRREMSEFRIEHLTGAGRPALVYDAMDSWSARQWTFQSLQRRFGRMPIRIKSSLLEKKNSHLVPFSGYVDYILSKDPENHILYDLDGMQVPNSPRWYSLSFHPFKEFPDLFDEFEETPSFIEDYLTTAFGNVAREVWRSFKHHWLFIGPKGSLSQFHTDHHSVITYLAQIAGRKLVFLAPPEASSAIYDQEGLPFNPLRPDFKRFPECQDLKIYYTVLSPGEMVVLPPNWFHFVLGLTPSITLSKDIVQRSNFPRYFMDLLVRDLPYYASKLAELPADLKQVANIQWRLKT